MNDASIVKYLDPIRAMQLIECKPEIASYLVRVHFPWLSGMLGSGIDAAELYHQGYLSMMGRAGQKYQEIYDAFIQPVIIGKLRQVAHLKSASDYMALYSQIIYDPIATRRILEGDSDVKLFADSILRNSIWEMNHTGEYRI